MRNRLRLPTLSALRAFEATVRNRSVSRAARELSLTDGAVSRAVRELEADLGFDLFQRSNRAVVPTATAQTLAEDVLGALERLQDALDRARRTDGPDRPLVLSCEPTLLMRWLIPRLGDLQIALGSERELRLVAAGGKVPFVQEGIDLAIRRADFQLPDKLRAERFFDEKVGPVCRPELVRKLSGRAVVTGTLLHAETRGAAWSQWSELTDISLCPDRELRFEHFYLSLQAAAAGAGVAIGPIALVADDIANGVLQAPWGFVADGSHYVLIAPTFEHEAKVFDLMLTWLRTQFATPAKVPDAQ